MIPDTRIELLKDDTYQLVKYSHDPYERHVIYQGSIQEIDAYVSLTVKGYEL